MNVGDKVVLIKKYDKLTQAGKEYVVKHYMPGGTKASDLFNQPMLVLEDDDEQGWIPASLVKIK